MSILKTHRGFILDSKSSHPAGYIDLPLVDTIYHHMETVDLFQNDFGYLEDVLRAAKQVLFDSKGRFILINQLKERPSAWVLSFTLSTLRFINGEQRQVSLENYRDLMVFHPSDAVVVDYGKLVREHNLGWFFEASAGQILAAWLAQEDGLTDLVQSLHLVAGSLPEGWHDRSDAA